MPAIICFLCFFVAKTLLCASAAAAAAADALAAKFDDHQFIFIGSTHGDVKIEEFLMCLVTRPAFQQRATDIVVERIGELVPAERVYLSAVGDPSKPFFVEARRFPTNIPWPQSLRISHLESSTNLADYIDAFVYLGPEPDKDLTGSIPLTAAQKRELERRNAINSDPKRSMQVRYKGRDQWFRAHPNDFPPRPN